MNKKEFFQNIVFLICLASTLFLLRQFVFTPVLVNGHSMDPTLSDQERLIAIKNQAIHRFDIVTFQAPDDPSMNYVKRVVGLPGESVAFQHDILYINGQAYAEPFLNNHLKNLLESERFTNDFTFETLMIDEYVPEGMFFVLGDNRPASKDSRAFGFISNDSIFGTARFAFWPLDRFGFIHAE